MTSNIANTLAKFANTNCTVFFWLGGISDETFPSLEGALQHASRHRVFADSIEIFVHSAVVRPPIISGEDLVALMES